MKMADILELNFIKFEEEEIYQVNDKTFRILQTEEIFSTYKGYRIFWYLDRTVRKRKMNNEVVAITQIWEGIIKARAYKQQYGVFLRYAYVNIKINRVGDNKCSYSIRMPKRMFTEEELRNRT